MVKFIWSIQNNIKGPYMLSDIGNSGLVLAKDEIVHLHERFPWEKLDQSKQLETAISKGFVKELKKEVFSSQIVNNTMNTASVPNEEVNELKKEIQDLKTIIIQQTDRNVNTQNTIDSNAINSHISSVIEQAFEKIKINNIPVVQDQTISKLEGFDEINPEDVVTNNLLKNSVVDKGKIEAGKTFKETKMKTNDNLADLLSSL